MTTNLVRNAQDFATEVVNVIQQKNADYAGSNQANEYRNFDLVADITGAPPALQLEIEIAKKVVRLANLYSQPNAVPGETFRESLRDIVGNAFIYESLLRDEEQAQQTAPSDENTTVTPSVESEKALSFEELDQTPLPALRAFLNSKLTGVADVA